MDILLHPCSYIFVHLCITNSSSFFSEMKHRWQNGIFVYSTEDCAAMGLDDGLLSANASCKPMLTYRSSDPIE